MQELYLDYQDDNIASIAQKELGTYSLFEANQLLCEGRLSSSQGIVWKRDQTSNEGYLHKGQNYIQDLDSEGLKCSQADK